MKCLDLKIIHISDLHLFVDEYGFNRDSNEKARITNNLQFIMQYKLTPALIKSKLIGDLLNHHSSDTLIAFEDTLSQIINNKRSEEKIIVIQTGDVEAYGFSGDDNNPLPGFKYWEAQKNNYSKDVVFVDLYGNHDVWPGGVPFLMINKVEKAIEYVRKRPEFKDALPILIKVQMNSYRIEIYPINTVCFGWPLNTLSVGKIQTDYPIREGYQSQYPLSKGKNPIKEIIALSDREKRNNKNEPAIRILVMHHPPHYFRSDKWTDLFGARLLSRIELKQLFYNKDIKFHIVSGGHRHLVDPPESKCPLGNSGQPQEPLPDTLIQLVAGSTTQEVSVKEIVAGSTTQQARVKKIKPSFCLYDVKFDNTSNQISIHRTIYEHERGRLKFIPGNYHKVKQVPLL